MRGVHSHAHHLKPNLAFDLFTIQLTNLLSGGQVNPNLKNFGLAWYQTDVRADSSGQAEVAAARRLGGWARDRANAPFAVAVLTVPSTAGGLCEGAKDAHSQCMR
jgi:hypothetical protein